MSVDDEEMRQFPARSFEFDLPFRLPHPELVEFDDDDRRALNDIQNETEMIFALNKYLFHTVYSAISLMHGWNPREPNDLWKIKKFIFEISNSLFIEPHAKWDIFALVRRFGSCLVSLIISDPLYNCSQAAMVMPFPWFLSSYTPNILTNRTLISWLENVWCVPFSP